MVKCQDEDGAICSASSDVPIVRGFDDLGLEHSVALYHDPTRCIH